MGPLDDRPEHRKVSKNWLLILMAIIPVWAVVMFVGWFVISTLVPMLGPDDTNQIADENPTKAIIDFSTASGDNGKEDKKSKKDQKPIP